MLKRTIWLLSVISISVFSACNNKQENVKSVENMENKEEVQKETKADDKVILFFGNSLTAGYGLEEDESFPSLIQNRLDSLGKNYTVINGGLSGETTSGGLNRIDWVLKQDIDLFVLELGPNDMLRGLNIKDTESNLRGIIDKVKAKFPEIPIIIAGMLAPPNMGEDYANTFKNIYVNLAKDYGAGLIPFLLDGVAGIKELNLQDQKHPNAAGQKIVVENVWAVLEDYI